jgi:hypothetical protein
MPAISLSRTFLVFLFFFFIFLLFYCFNITIADCRLLLSLSPYLGQLNDSILKAMNIGVNSVRTQTNTHRRLLPLQLDVAYLVANRYSKLINISIINTRTVS